MAYTICAVYTVMPGEESTVETALAAMIDLSRREPACLTYEVNRSTEDPRVFCLYERYRDEQGFQAHVASDYFSRHIRDVVWPRLEHRQRFIGEPLPASLG
ncbi:MAG: putative quinol monooxygenase [Solirubrobacterales bacterium]